jgi:hypothetical protein
LGDVSDATDSELEGEKDAATSVEEAFPEARFVRRALAEGFTVDEVLKAGEHLLLNPAATSGSCTKSTNLKGNGLLARRIVDSVAKRRKSSVKPWKGPLPRARISQPLTIGDKLVEAFTAKLSNSVKFRKAWVPIATRQENEATLSRERDESCAGLREEDDKEVFLATEEERRELIFGSTTGQLETRQPRGVEEFGRFLVSRFKLKKDSGPSKQFYLGTGHKVQIKFHFGAGQLLSWAGQHERVKNRLGQPPTLGILSNTAGHSSPVRTYTHILQRSSSETEQATESEQQIREVSTMAHREDWDRQGNRGWGRRDDSHWEDEGNFFQERGGGEDFHFRFHPGLGFNREGGGRGWMSQGFRPRGARSFGTRRGGFAGRPGRSGAHHAGRSNLPSYGQRVMDSGTGRAEKTTMGSGSNKGGTLVSRWDKSAEGSRKVLGGKKEAWQNKVGDLGASVAGKEGRGKMW